MYFNYSLSKYKVYFSKNVRIQVCLTMFLLKMSKACYGLTDDEDLFAIDNGPR